MEKQIDFQKMAELIVKNGGGTFNLSGYSMVDLDRWSVGIVGVKFQYKAFQYGTADIADALAGFFRLVSYLVNDHGSDLAEKIKYVGAWIDGGVLYLDIVSLIADSEEAMALAKKYNQKAIYNLKYGCTAPVL